MIKIKNVTSSSVSKRVNQILVGETFRGHIAGKGTLFLKLTEHCVVALDAPSYWDVVSPTGWTLECHQYEPVDVVLSVTRKGEGE